MYDLDKCSIRPCCFQKDHTSAYDAWAKVEEIIPQKKSRKLSKNCTDVNEILKGLFLSYPTTLLIRYDSRTLPKYLDLGI